MQFIPNSEMETEIPLWGKCRHWRHFIFYFSEDWYKWLRLRCVCCDLVTISSSHTLQGYFISWWRHQMEPFSALLAICAGNSPVPGEFPTQRPVTPSFDVFLDLRLNKRLSKQWWGWWFDTLSRPLWRHRNGLLVKQLWRENNWGNIHKNKAQNAYGYFVGCAVWHVCNGYALSFVRRISIMHAMPQSRNHKT